MTRTEENNEMLDAINKQINKYASINYEEVKVMALLDISKSLAVIADGLRKEDKNNDKR
jgi:hypothetical protein